MICRFYLGAPFKFITVVVLTNGIVQSLYVVEISQFFLVFYHLYFFYRLLQIIQYDSCIYSMTEETALLAWL
jgi:hypothetical protein